ncbi:MAG: hypothetical protein HZA49_07610 [Planctomycetes bacterium]|nr:hypothetical protein [Planctomycetota bacterium]
MNIKYLSAITLALILGLGLNNAFKVYSQDMTDQQKEQTAKEFYDAGLGALKDKKYDTARDFFLKSISYDERLAEAYAKLGDAYILLKENELGYENRKKFIAMVDAAVNPSEDIIKLYDEVSGKIKKFQAVEEKASVLNKEFITKLLELGQASLEAGDCLKAIEIFTFILTMEENLTRAAESLSRAKEESAKNEVEEIPNADVDLAKVYYDAGLDLAKQNKINEAIEKFTKALTYRKASPEIFFSLGECHEKLKDAKKAIVNYGFCHNYLQTRNPRSKDDDALLTKAAKCLEKLNPNIPAFAKAKKDYMAKALIVARDYVNNKYQHLAYILLCAILKVDRQNKEADSLLLKIDRDVISYQNRRMVLAQLKLKPKGASVTMFNGKDLADWYLQMYMDGVSAKDCFSVQNGKMVIIPKNSKHGSLILWNKKLPETCMISVKFFPDKMIDEDKAAFVCVLRGLVDSGLGNLHMNAAQGGIDKDSLKKVHTYDYIIGPNIHAISIDAEDAVNIKIDSSIPEIKFGILATNLKMEISSVVMQELEETTK